MKLFSGYKKLKTIWRLYRAAPALFMRFDFARKEACMLREENRKLREQIENSLEKDAARKKGSIE